MEGEGKLCVEITKFDDGFQVHAHNVSRIDLVLSMGALSDTVKKHAGQDEWCAIVGTLLAEVYETCGEEKYSRLLEIVADKIDGKF